MVCGDERQKLQSFSQIPEKKICKKYIFCITDGAAVVTENVDEQTEQNTHKYLRKKSWMASSLIIIQS